MLHKAFTTHYGGLVFVCGIKSAQLRYYHQVHGLCCWWWSYLFSWVLPLYCAQQFSSDIKLSCRLVCPSCCSKCESIHGPLKWTGLIVTRLGEWVLKAKIQCCQYYRSAICANCIKCFQFEMAFTLQCRQYPIGYRCMLEWVLEAKIQCCQQ